jgi:hypothetical protein
VESPSGACRHSPLNSEPIASPYPLTPRHRDDWIRPKYFPFHIKRRRAYVSIRDFEFALNPDDGVDPLLIGAFFVHFGWSLDMMRTILRVFGGLSARVPSPDGAHTPKRLLDVSQCLSSLSSFAGHAGVPAAALVNQVRDRLGALRLFYEVVRVLGYAFHVDPFVEVGDGVSLAEAMGARPYMLDGVELVRPEVIFWFPNPGTIPRTFDGSIDRGKRKLAFRFRLIWAICPTDAFFLRSRLDLTAGGRPSKVPADEIQEAEFCCFQFAGITPDPPPE